MNTRRIVVLVSCVLLAYSGLVGCGDSDEDPDNNQENQNANANQNNTEENQNNDEEWREFPMDGIYEVTSHTAQSDGCEGSGEPVTDGTGNFMRVEGVAFQDLDYMIEFCESADAQDCESWGFFIRFDDEQAHVDAGLEPGIISETYRVSTRSEADDICELEGHSSEVEWTGDGMIIRRMDTELEFSTSSESNEPWICASGSNQDQATAEAMECVALEVLEATLVD